MPLLDHCCGMNERSATLRNDALL